MKVFSLIVFTLCCLAPLRATAATRTFAYDYVVGDEASIDRYVMQRKIVGGAYADLAVTALPTARTITDTTITPGVPYCWQLMAEKTDVGRSVASNEVCATFRARGRTPGRMQAR